jgi:hypothetical protein
MSINNGWAKPAVMAAFFALSVIPLAQATDLKPTPTTVKTVAPASTSTTSNTLDSRKAARDSETGQLRAPTTEENAELDAATARSRGTSTNVVVLRRPITTAEVRADGSVVAKRSLDDMDNLVAERRTDGKLAIRHGNVAPAAAPATTPAVEK